MECREKKTRYCPEMSKASKNTECTCIVPLFHLRTVVSGVCGSGSMRLNDDDITCEYYI